MTPEDIEAMWEKLRDRGRRDGELYGEAWTNWTKPSLVSEKHLEAELEHIWQSAFKGETLREFFLALDAIQKQTKFPGVLEYPKNIPPILQMYYEGFIEGARAVLESLLHADLPEDPDIDGFLEEMGLK